MKELLSYVFSPLREGDIALCRGSGDGLAPILLVAAEETSLGSVARAITVSNARADQQGLATVNPIFTWVRLAQRVPVRIQIKEVPDGVRLVAGMTATIEVVPRPARQSK